MKLHFNPNNDQGGAEFTLNIDQREMELLGEEIALPILLHRTMEAILALRADQRPAGNSTEAGNWADIIHRTSTLIRNVNGVLDGAIRAHAAAKGSYGQLAKALGVPRSTAQSRREALLGEQPGPWEPRPSGSDGRPAGVRALADGDLA